MKKPATPKPINPKLLFVTLREIEDAGPCSGKYFDFLREIKSNCLHDGNFSGIPYRRFKKPRYDPDDPIPLRLIADSGDGTYRIGWLMNHVGRLNPLVARSEALDRETSAALNREDMALLRQIELLNRQRAQLQAKADSHPGPVDLLIADLPPVAKRKNKPR